VIFHPPLSKG